MELLKGHEIERLRREVKALEREQKLDEVAYSMIEEENNVEYEFFLKELHKQIKSREKRIIKIKDKIES